MSRSATSFSSIILLFILHAYLPASAEQHRAPCAYDYEQSVIPTNAGRMLAEIFRPRDKGLHPLVLLLHGSAGAFTTRSGHKASTDNLGETAFAQSCYIVVFPHYLEAIGRKSLTSHDEIVSKFPTLANIVTTALASAEALPKVQRDSIYVVGDSLGAYLAIALAFSRCEIRAVSEISGGRPSGYDIAAGCHPAILITHGSVDNEVSPSEAISLQRYCAMHGLQVKLTMLPRETHYLPPDGLALAIEQSIAFFAKHGSVNPH
jgi:predicted peptidase